MKVRVLKKTGDKEVGKTYDIDVDSKGVPLSRFWRKRLADKGTDNNIQIIVDEPKSSTKKSEKK